MKGKRDEDYLEVLPDDYRLSAYIDTRRREYPNGSDAEWNPLLVGGG